MNFLDLKCINDDVNLTDYLKLELNEIKEILANGGKIWLYYDNEILYVQCFTFL